MKIKTIELTGAALDWAVAKCEGFIKVAIWPDHIGVCKKHSFENQLRWKPSTNHAQGGPIIEREKIATGPYGDDWWAQHNEGKGEYLNVYGQTQLIAAMRCYVASKLGEEVDIPDELQMVHV